MAKQRLSSRVSRRAVLKTLAGLPMGLAAWGRVAQAASDFPSHPIRLIVPFAAGGGADVMSRILANAMGQRLGQTVIVENVTGAGGTIGASQLAQAAPDGYTLMTGTPSTIHINPAMQAGLRYQPDKDFAAISQFSDSPAVLVVNKDQPWKTVRELIDALKAKPGSVNFGSAGIGSFEHLSAELFSSLAGVKMVHVPYRGTSQSLTDLRAGSIQVLFENLPPVLGAIRNGDLRALGMGSAQRSSFLPDVPTIAEAGVPGYESTSWQGLFVPAGTPAAVIDVLQRAAMEAARDPKVVKAFRDMGAEAIGSDSAAFGKFITQRRVVIERLVKSAGMRAD